MTKYDKPFLDISKQISLFRERGLIFQDEEMAKFYLRHISYYHLSIYAKSFQGTDEKFQEGTTFEDIISLYNFDKKLRLLVLDVLERIEMSFKCVLAYEITRNKDDNFWYLNESNFRNSENSKLLEKIKESKEIYIKHFYNKYTKSDYPPAWMFFESLSFGECSHLSRGLHNSDRQVIAGFYKLSKRSAIQIIYYLSHLRNICAHHSRLWNRKFTIEIEKNKRYNEILQHNSRDSLFAYFVVMQIFLIKISPSSSWLERLKMLIEEGDIPIYKMGFPEDWYKRLRSIK